MLMSEAMVFGLSSNFSEPDCSKDASKFLTDNYDEVVMQTRKMGVHPDMVNDLVGDVYISLIRSEENGDGYQFDYYSEGITVEEFVYGRIKAYSKNTKYRVDIVQSSGYVADINISEELRKIEEIDDESIRNIKKLELMDQRKKRGCIIYAASTNGEELDNMDSFQKAYSLAGSYDDIGDTEMMIDLQEKIDYCLEFEEQIGISIIGILKNIDLISSDINASIFSKLRSAVRYHDEFGETLREIIEFSARKRACFDEVIKAY